ncbi:MAG: inorganic phosphate transporter, partial [Candidatus Binatia bacterium]
CAGPQAGALFGITGAHLLDAGHFISAGAVSFARGLNDTPKIVALGLVASSMNLKWAIGLVTLVMAIGGLLSAKKVAETVSQRITAMDPDQGLAANLVTSGLVILASKWGVPVSTTHVSCGALFGIGLANGQARWQVIRIILFAWLLTLPTAAVLSAGFYCLFKIL